MSHLSSAPEPEAPDTDLKYIIFKREELFQHIGFSDAIHSKLSELELADAVVIRRQDLFASTAFATYASSIAMVAKALDRMDLRNVADYFQRQSELAADEGYKFPDI